MARPLRIAIEDGWYHVINRGIERRSIFSLRSTLAICSNCWRSCRPGAALQQALAGLKGEPWEAFAERRGDDGRDLALLLVRRSGGYTLSELGTFVGVSYAAVAQAVTKAEHRIAHSVATRKLYNKLCITFKIET